MKRTLPRLNVKETIIFYLRFAIIFEIENRQWIKTRLQPKYVHGCVIRAYRSFTEELNFWALQRYADRDEIRNMIVFWSQHIPGFAVEVLNSTLNYDCFVLVRQESVEIFEWCAGVKTAYRVDRNDHLASVFGQFPPSTSRYNQMLRKKGTEQLVEMLLNTKIWPWIDLTFLRLEEMKLFKSWYPTPMSPWMDQCNIYDYDEQLDKQMISRSIWRH